jgi:Tfp pilus assembly protein PilX
MGAACDQKLTAPKARKPRRGVVLLITIMVVAMLAAVVMGILKVNAEEIKLFRNQLYAVKALAIAEAGLNDAFYELRSDSGWTDGFDEKTFADGTYTVAVSGTLPNLTVTSAGVCRQGYSARIQAEVTVGTSSPYIIRVDSYRINR